jgi:hypothetical protein
MTGRADSLARQRVQRHIITKKLFTLGPRTPRVGLKRLEATLDLGLDVLDRTTL